MKFFNIDLHVSVINDIKTIFNALGHEVDSLSLSSHDWVFKSSEPPEIINKNNWMNLDDELIDKFYLYYKNKLINYDGFIVTHTPFFCKLYEKFNKPIIVVSSTRYEYPYTNNKEKWIDLNNTLIKNKNIIVLSNNLFDKTYCELFLNKEIKLIESLCSYTNAKYKPSKNNSVLYSKIPINIDGCINKSNLSKITWQELYSYKSIVHIPYNVSTMSIFEQYYANVPLILPSLEFTKKMLGNNVPIFSEISYRKVMGLNADNILNVKNDPNKFDDINNLYEWIKLSDFYKFKNIITFESFQELNDILKRDHQNISFKMQIENYDREEIIFSSWKSLLKDIK